MQEMGTGRGSRAGEGGRRDRCGDEGRNEDDPPEDAKKEELEDAKKEDESTEGEPKYTRGKSARLRERSVKTASLLPPPPASAAHHRKHVPNTSKIELSAESTATKRKEQMKDEREPEPELGPAIASTCFIAFCEHSPLHSNLEGSDTEDDVAPGAAVFERHAFASGPSAASGATRAKAKAAASDTESLQDDGPRRPVTRAAAKQEEQEEKAEEVEEAFASRPSAASRATRAKAKVERTLKQGRASREAEKEEEEDEGEEDEAGDEEEEGAGAIRRSARLRGVAATPTQARGSLETKRQAAFETESLEDGPPPRRRLVGIAPRGQHPPVRRTVPPVSSSSEASSEEVILRSRPNRRPVTRAKSKKAVDRSDSDFHTNSLEESESEDLAGTDLEERQAVPAPLGAKTLLKRARARSMQAKAQESATESLEQDEQQDEPGAVNGKVEVLIARRPRRRRSSAAETQRIPKEEFLEGSKGSSGSSESSSSSSSSREPEEKRRRLEQKKARRGLKEASELVQRLLRQSSGKQENDFSNPAADGADGHASAAGSACPAKPTSANGGLKLEPLLVANVSDILRKALEKGDRAAEGLAEDPESSAKLGQALAIALAAESTSERDYKTRARSLSFNLSRNKDLRLKLFSAEVKPEEVVSLDVWDLATDALKEERVQERDKSLKEVIIPNDSCTGWRKPDNGNEEKVHFKDALHPSIAPPSLTGIGTDIEDARAAGDPHDETTFLQPS